MISDRSATWRTLHTSSFFQSLIEMDHHGIKYISGKLPTYPWANINAYFSLRAKCWLKGGYVGSFPETYNKHLMTGSEEKH